MKAVSLGGKEWLLNAINAMNSVDFQEFWTSFLLASSKAFGTFCFQNMMPTGNRLVSKFETNTSQKYVYIQILYVYLYTLAYTEYYIPGPIPSDGSRQLLVVCTSI